MRKREKPGRNAVLKFSEHKRKRADSLEADIDALFELPWVEFTGARNTLAAQLKKSGRGDEAVRVKALAKPPVSAWAVNQLYWNHREAFDQLIASGERFHKAQTSGKMAEMRTALDARREALAELTDLATSLLQDADHNPSLDTIRRVTTTLEGMSVYASRSDAPRPGRLTHDVDPPGFESFGSFVPGAGFTRPTKEPVRPAPSQKASATPTNTRRKVATDDGVRQLEQTRKVKIAEAKASLQDARRFLTEARTRAQRSEAVQKKADAEAKKAEQHRLDAEQSLKKAQAASVDAARRARNAAVEREEAVGAADNAERAVEAASQEIDSLVRGWSGK